MNYKNKIIFSKLKEEDEFDNALGNAMIKGNLMEEDETLMLFKKKGSKFYVRFPHVKVVQVRVNLWNHFGSELVQTITGNDLKEAQKGKYCKFSLKFSHKLGITNLSRVTFVIVVRNEISGAEEEINPKIVVPLYDGGKGSVKDKMKKFHKALEAIDETPKRVIKRGCIDDVPTDTPKTKRSKCASSFDDASAPQETETTIVVQDIGLESPHEVVCGLLQMLNQNSSSISLQQHTDFLLLDNLNGNVTDNGVAQTEQHYKLEEQEKFDINKFFLEDEF